MDGGIGFLLFICVVLVGILVLYIRAKRPKKLEPVPAPAPPPAPMGPRPGPLGSGGSAAPGYRPAAPLKFLGNFGPQYLTGKMRELSEEALVQTETFTDVRRDNPAIPQGQTEATADFLAAIRWYRFGVDPKVTDRNLMADGFGITEMTRILDTYRTLPPSEDRDQAIRILTYYLPMESTPGLDEPTIMALVVAAKLWVFEQQKLPPEQRSPWNRFRPRGT
jgi:hypothetical protein